MGELAFRADAPDETATTLAVTCTENRRRLAGDPRSLFVLIRFQEYGV
jgi:hypothetical protein